MVPINVKEKEFDRLMYIYSTAIFQVNNELVDLQKTLRSFYNYDVINNINSRIKTPESIINKMKKKNYNLNYKALIDNINDVAGIRIVCPFKSDISKVKGILELNDMLDIIEIKDYLHKPKRSGYSGLHIIANTPVKIGEKKLPVKLEIQIRSMAMDFWATTEHKIKYKAKNKLSKLDSKKMSMYAKLINNLDKKIADIHDKYER